MLGTLSAGPLPLACWPSPRAAIPLLSNRVLENLLFKALPIGPSLVWWRTAERIITDDADAPVFGNGMYDGRFTRDCREIETEIIRPMRLSLFHAAPRDVLMIGLSSGSWAQVIASNPAVTSLTVVEINRGYMTLIAQQPEVASLLRNQRLKS